MKLYKRIKSIIDSIPGKIGFYYEDLNSGVSIAFNEDDSFLAASIIKVPILIETLKQIEDGILKKYMKINVSKDDKVPSCGALNYMHDDIEVTIEDLYTLMIVLSDNTATNILIDLAGMENINNTIIDLDFPCIKLNRLLFDEIEQKKGKENYFSPKNMGELLKKVYNGEIVSESISREVERVMKMQLLNSKLPYLLPDSLEIAHKTGEDSSITHDVGIVYSENPFIFCFAANNTDVPMAEDALKKIAVLSYENSLTL